MWDFFKLRKNVLFLGLVSLFNDFSNEMIHSIMPFFLAVTLGISKVEIGLIEGVANVMSSFLRIFSGWLSDKIGKRKLPAVLGYALSVSTRPFFILVSSFSQVFALRVVDRIGKGFRDSPRDALLAASVSNGELGKSFGYQRAMDALGGLMGPIGAALIVWVFIGRVDYKDLVPSDYTPIFLAAFAVGLLALASFFFVREVPGIKQDISLRSDLELLRKDKDFMLFISAIFIFGLGTIPTILMFVRPIELGFNLFAVPVAYFIYGLTNAIAAVPLGKLSDKFGESPVIVLGFAAAIIATFLLAFTSSVALAIFSFILMGLYSAATDGIERALASRLVVPKLLATGEGTLQAAIGVSSLISAVFGGLLWDGYGHTFAFAYWGAMSVMGLLTFVLVSKRFRVNKN